MSDDIELGFSSDMGKLLQNLNDTRLALIAINDETKKAKKEMAESFQQGEKGAHLFKTELDAAIKKQAEQAAIIDAINKKLKEMEAAGKSSFSGDELGKYNQKIKALEDEIVKLRNQLKEFGNDSKKSGQQASDAMSHYATVIEMAKQKLSTLKPGSGEFKKLETEIKAAELAGSKLNVTIDENGDVTQTARQELAQMREALIALKREGLDTTEVYEGLKDEAGELADTIGDVNEEFKTVGSDTSGLDKVVRGVQLATNVMGAYEGVVALTGKKNEDFEKTMIRLNALMTISNSLQQVMAELKRADNVITGIQIGLQKTYAFVVGNTTGALKAMRIALAMTGVGLLVIALGYLVSRLSDTSDAADDAAASLDNLNNKLAFSKTLVDGQVEAITRTTNLAIEKAKQLGKSEVEQFAISAKGRAGEIAALKTYRESLRVQYEKGIADKKTTGEQLNAINEQLKNTNKAILDKEYEQQISYEKEKTRVADKARDDAKKNNDKARQDAEAALQKRKEIAARIVQLEKDLAAAKIEAMKDGMAKEIAIENNNSKNTIEALERQRVDATKKEQQLIDQLIQREKLTHFARLLAIEQKYIDDASKVQEEAYKEVQGLILNEQAKEEQQLKEHYDNALKLVTEAKKLAIEAGKSSFAANIIAANQEATLNEWLAKQRVDITKKYGLQQLEQAEALAVAQNDIMLKDGLNREALEKLKETNKLNIVIEFANKKLEVLKAAGTAENALQIALLEKNIQDARAKLKDLEKEKDFDIFDLLGINFENEKQKQRMVDAINIIKDSISTLFGSLADIQDGKLKKQKDIISAIQDEINAREDAVNREKKLAEDGYANNLLIEQQKLNDLKAQKAEELRVEEELQRKKEAFQKAQIVMDSISQASSLITASSKILSAFASIPIVGVPLAIAAIGLMFGSFATAKISALKAVSKSETGGRIAKGKRHSGGGNKYVSMDGNDPDIQEIEKGEWVIKRSSSEKYNPLLEAVNNDDEGGISRFVLRRILKPMGISLPEEVPQRIIRQAEAKNNTIVVNAGGSDQKNWDKANGYLEKIAGKNEKEIEYYDGYRIEKEPGRTRKIITKKDA